MASKRRWGWLWLVVFGSVAWAQTGAYPSKPIRILVTTPAGSGADFFARTLAQGLSDTYKGVAPLVENRPGAGGIIGAREVANAAPDGYTMTLVTNSNIVQRFIQKDIGYDPLNDFSHVTQLTLGGSVMVVPADSPIKSYEELVAAAKAAPGKFNYGTGGNGTPSHMAAATLGAVFGLDMIHVPFKNSADVVPAILRGDLQFSFQVQSFAMPFVRSGKLRVLAITTGKRFSGMPEIPTMLELTKNELLVQETWAGVSMAPKTPPAIVRRLHSEYFKVMQDPTVLKGIAAGGSNPNPSESPEAYLTFFSKEYEKLREVVRLSGVKAD